ncbi:glutathione S-transferase [Pacificimonas flava]|uniref:Glutathione S-transferase n=2 Tax=Pacificimonas TaxID=1960290 RepID=A0A219B0D8_9SPHN|nr:MULTISPECIES: glutathione S-transferase [Pacificimonas]MBZ6379753.1 glutathione S-transferase [Pacificimonas aurantium]OWV31791.1 glutathione S-transferase [Pacificimonas flava]
MTYDFWYWPGIPGRGEFARIALEAGGIPYRERGRDEGADVWAKRDSYDATPPYAPPWLDTGELVIAQTANICLFLGDEHGLAPDGRKGRLWTHQLMLTIMDVTAEAHDTHHPIASSAYYDEQKDAAARRAEQFRKERIPKFLVHFQKALGTDLLFGGVTWSYADTGFYVLMSGLCHAFPKRMAALEDEFRPLFAHRDRIAKLPELQDYFKSERCLPFGEGIFRHYPELDGAD